MTTKKESRLKICTHRAFIAKLVDHLHFYVTDPGRLSSLHGYWLFRKLLHEYDILIGLVANDTIATLFHNSETFEKLSDESTGLYIESSAYVYEILKSEIKMGRIL